MLHSIINRLFSQYHVTELSTPSLLLIRAGASSTRGRIAKPVRLVEAGEAGLLWFLLISREASNAHADEAEEAAGPHLPLHQLSGSFSDRFGR
jgi:hypothetical protein